MKKILIIGSILVILGLLVGFLVIPALADEPNTTGTNPYGGVFLDDPMLQRVAKALGLAPAELTTRLQGGQTLAKIAADQKVAKEKVVEVIIKPYQEELQLRVKYDYITQEQADTLLAQARERALALLEQDLSGAGEYDNYSWQQMEEYCHGNGSTGGGGMMGGWQNGWGGMMGGWNSGNQNGTAGNGWGGITRGFGGMMGGLGRGITGGFGGMMGGLGGMMGW